MRMNFIFIPRMQLLASYNFTATGEVRVEQSEAVRIPRHTRRTLPQPHERILQSLNFIR